MRPHSALALALAICVLTGESLGLVPWLEGRVAGLVRPSATRSHAPLQVSFHHVHVNDHLPGHLLSYYGKLFDPSTTSPSAIGGLEGIESAGVFLLITQVREEPPEAGGAGWHFGWGRVSLDEAYDRHRMREIDLQLPLESFAKDLHMHVESEDPVRAAAWYCDRLAARIATDPRNTQVRPPNPFHRRPAAVVELPGITLAIYQSAAALSPSRGHRIDHLAFAVDLAQAREAGFTMLEPAGRLGPFETMMIEGPDRLAIELVGAPTLKRGSGIMAVGGGPWAVGNRHSAPGTRHRQSGKDQP